MKKFPQSLLSCGAAALAFGISAVAQAQLPEGNGKQVVQTVCAACHDLSPITSSGRTREEWDSVVHDMIAMGATLTPDQITLVTNYLASTSAEATCGRAVNFRNGAELQGDPAPDQAFRTIPSRDDGSIWYGAIRKLLGRVDRNRRGQELSAEDPGLQAGLIGATAGNIWFTANFAGYIGKLDPKTGAITEYKTPGARDPHSLSFDQDGILWFTAQGANMIGRLDPKSGDIKMIDVPTRRAAPYGMVVSSKGVPFFAEFGTNRLGSIDPKTLKITEYVLPDATTRPRRIAITSDDALWYGDFTASPGRHDPKTGKARSGVLAAGLRPVRDHAANDVIWYCESGASPNTLVRFDPKTEKFQTFRIPSGGGTVRNMMPTKDGNLALAESGVNMVALVTLK
jgi:virginiamycin B lyase